MGRFVGKLRLEEYGSNQWIVLTPLSYFTSINNSVIEITVPTGFINDLASIPRPLQAIIPKVAKHRRAAVVHDYLYQRRGDLSFIQLTRKQCDGIFLDAMKADGVRFTRRWAMYLGVRSGGWLFWSKGNA